MPAYRVTGAASQLDEMLKPMVEAAGKSAERVNKVVVRAVEAARLNPADVATVIVVDEPSVFSVTIYPGA